MNHNELENFKFWDLIDQEIVRSRFSGNRRVSIYPSESSVVATDLETGEKYVTGGCNRKAWYRIFGFPKAQRLPRSAYILEIGKAIENMVTDLCKQAGIYENNSIKFWDHTNYVSGEIDIVVKLPMSNDGKYVIIEMKTSSGGRVYRGYESGPAKELFDHYEGRGKDRKMVKKKPKDSHLLQIGTYLFNYMDDENLIGGKITYLLRDNCSRVEHNVTITKENDSHFFVVNGEVERRFTCEDVINRYNELKNKIFQDYQLIQNGVKFEELVPPERDYTLQYSEEQAEELHKAGRLSESKLKSVMKKKDTVGDFQCSYCDYKKVCWNLGEGE